MAHLLDYFCTAAPVMHRAESATSRPGLNFRRSKQKVSVHARQKRTVSEAGENTQPRKAIHDPGTMIHSVGALEVAVQNRMIFAKTHANDLAAHLSSGTALKHHVPRISTFGRSAWSGKTTASNPHHQASLGVHSQNVSSTFLTLVTHNTPK